MYNVNKHGNRVESDGGWKWGMNSTRKIQGGLSGKGTFFLWGRGGAETFDKDLKNEREAALWRTNRRVFQGVADSKWKFSEGQKEGLKWLKCGWAVRGHGKWWSWRGGQEAYPTGPVGPCEELGFYLLVKASPWRVRSLGALWTDFYSILMKSSNPHIVTLSKSHSLGSQNTSPEVDWAKGRFALLPEPEYRQQL